MVTYSVKCSTIMPMNSIWSALTSQCSEGLAATSSTHAICTIVRQRLLDSAKEQQK